MSLVGVAPASAEIFFDLYGGAAIFGDPDFTLTVDGESRDTERGTADTDATFGGRGGYWLTESRRTEGVEMKHVGFIDHTMGGAT